MTSTRKVCGVCTAQSLERSTLRAMVWPSAVSLIVSVWNCAATAAPVSRAASIVAAISWSSCKAARHPEWRRFQMRMAASSPFRRPCRSAHQPRGGTAWSVGAARGSAKADCIPSRTRMISAIQAASLKRCHVCATTGRPRRLRKSLSRPAHAVAPSGGDDDGAVHCA